MVEQQESTTSHFLIYITKDHYCYEISISYITNYNLLHIFTNAKTMIDMKTVKKYIKSGLNWYFNQYVEFYRKMIENNVNPFTI